MNKRPKSREETPKEGSDSKALPHCNSMRLHCTKCKDFRNISDAKCTGITPPERRS